MFPGGNYDQKQDEGHGLPFTAIRELFEESGLLLVHPSSSGVPSNAELDAAREAVHTQKRLFHDFLSEHNLKPNIEGLLPFTRWITPPNIPRYVHPRDVRSTTPLPMATADNAVRSLYGPFMR